MKIYRHPTLDEREYLEKSLKTGKSLRQIAAALGRSPSTISREIKRNQSAAEPAPPTTTGRPKRATSTGGSSAIAGII